MFAYAFGELQHSNDVRGPLRLYVFNQNGYHSGGAWFRRKVVYPDEEIGLDEAKRRAEEAITAGLEVRITNGGDFLVFHAVGGQVLFPSEPSAFWERAAA